MLKSISKREVSSIFLIISIGFNLSAYFWVLLTILAIHLKSSMSCLNAFSIPGLRIFTATSSLFFVIAKWTWAILAAAIGFSLKSKNKSSISFSKLILIISRTSFIEKGGSLSLSSARSSATLCPIRSGLVDQVCPNLMKLGPNSCNAFFVYLSKIIGKR